MVASLFGNEPQCDPATPRRMTMAITTPLPLLRELDQRVSDGIEVSLLWNQENDELIVAVLDTKLGDAFDVRVHEDERATDVFRHPYFYAAAHGAREPRRVVILEAQ
jgi:hypothetical protein